MKMVWYIGQNVNTETWYWELGGIFSTKEEAFGNLEIGDFCASIEFGVKLSHDTQYPKEAYWKMEDGQILPSTSNY
jgi:hypothetical protein